MRESNISKAKRIGKIIAQKMSEELWIDHPEYRGKALTLDNFPDFIFRTTKVSCFMYFHHNTKNMEQLEIVCANSAKSFAKKWIKKYELSNID